VKFCRAGSRAAALTQVVGLLIESLPISVGFVAKTDCRPCESGGGKRASHAQRRSVAIMSVSRRSVCRPRIAPIVRARPIATRGRGAFLRRSCPAGNGLPARGITNRVHRVLPDLVLRIPHLTEQSLFRLAGGRRLPVQRSA